MRRAALVSIALVLGLCAFSQQAFTKTCLTSPEIFKKMPQKVGYFSVQSETETENANDSKRLPFNYLLANTAEAMQYGFQYSCPETIAKTQILFQFASPYIPNFHMNNVEAWLDIAFINAQGEIIDILTMKTYEPNQEKVFYSPSKPALYALEARLGFFNEMKIKVGDRVWLQ